MAKEVKFVEDEGLVVLANKVIKENRLDWCCSIPIKFVLVDPEISRAVHARCIKSNNELKHFGGFIYLVEFSKKIWNSIDNQTREILMLHELLHILVKKDKKGNDVFSLAQHDIVDFYSVIKKFGVDWFREYKDVVAATYEMQGAEKDSIKI